MVARPWSSSRLSCGERLLLRCDGNAGNSFPTTQGKDPSSRARSRNRGSSGCGQNSRASSRVETGMSGNLLSCSKGVKDPFAVREVRCDYPRDASEEMGLISPGGENLLDFLELRQVLSTYEGDLRDPLWWLRKGHSPLDLLGVLSGFLSSADMDLGVHLESPQGSQSSSRVGACTCAFLPSCSSSVTLPFAWIKGSVSFPRGFPMRISHEAFPQGCPSCHRGVSRSSA